MVVQPSSQSHGNSLQRCCFSLVWNKFLHRWTIQCLRITLLTINRDKEIRLHCSRGIPLSLDTSVKMHTSEHEWSFCLIVSLRTHESFCQNDLISWHLQNIYRYRCFLKGSWSKWPIQTKSVYIQPSPNDFLPSQQNLYKLYLRQFSLQTRTLPTLCILYP